MDYLQILTNGVYESTLHRVINNSPKYRVCVAYFYEVGLSFSVYDFIFNVISILNGLIAVFSYFE